MLVEAAGASKRYGDTWALRGVSLSLDKGFHILAGPNGSGKTTLLKIFAGLMKPTEGKVSIDGGNPYRDPGLREKISYVPERLYLPPSLRVSDSIELWRRFPGWCDECFERLRSMLGLSFMDKRVGELSEGMRQKLSLALFLSRRPSVILADEPTVNLDPPSRFKIILELRRLAEKGASVIMATHSLYTAALAADTLIMLVDGRIRGSLSMGELRGSGSIKARLRARIPSPPEEPWLERLGGELFVVKASSIEEMLARLVELSSRGVIMAIDPILPGLEEAYEAGGEA